MPTTEVRATTYKARIGLLKQLYNQRQDGNYRHESRIPEDIRAKGVVKARSLNEALRRRLDGIAKVNKLWDELDEAEAACEKISAAFDRASEMGQNDYDIEVLSAVAAAA